MEVCSFTFLRLFCGCKQPHSLLGHSILPITLPLPASFFGAFPVQHSQPVAVQRNFVLHDDKAAKSSSIFLKSLTLYCNERKKKSLYLNSFFNFLLGWCTSGMSYFQMVTLLEHYFQNLNVICVIKCFQSISCQSVFCNFCIFARFFIQLL